MGRVQAAPSLVLSPHTHVLAKGMSCICVMCIGALPELGKLMVA